MFVEYRGFFILERDAVCESCAVSTRLSVSSGLIAIRLYGYLLRARVLLRS
ncbi:hypothetical protein RRSWK_01913 [Rhodopirellula sp. SWK7]|nr:hypothetical protein RRSWK_01913 [Rhodopirellula sp. SWK7]